MRDAVVFGGSGFLGSYVAEELARREYNVLIADTREPQSVLSGFDFVRCDIMNVREVERAVSGRSIVYNFAGFANLDASIHHPRETIEKNVIGTINVLEACRGADIRRFIYASSAYALSAKGAFYGISKFASEKIVEEFYNRFSIPFSIVRYGSLYGERANPDNAIYRWITQAYRDGRIVHNGNGDEIREYIHASDAATLSVDILEDTKFENQLIVLTGVERMKQSEILQMIKEIFNDRISVEFTGKKLEGHYTVTPYSLYPSVARKLVLNEFMDLGQGLIEYAKHIYRTEIDKSE